jgi:replicative DNA helicase
VTGTNGTRLAAADALLANLSTDRTAVPRNVASSGQPWEPPTPLGERQRPPAFPIDSLPGWLADEVAAVATFTQTPPDLAGCLALACLSTAAGGRAAVAVRGGEDGWREPVNLYTAVAMHAGSRKSAVFAIMTAPLLAAERELVEQVNRTRVEAEQAKRIAERDAARAEQLATSTDPGQRDSAMADAISAAMLAEGIKVPVVPQLVADDLTPEAAASLLSEQGGRLALLSAEGGVFAAMAGRYTGVPSIEVLLKGHSGDLLRVNRKGRPPEHVDHPALTLGLAVQPSVFRDIATMPGFRDRGLLARILYSLPDNTVGRRHIGEPPVPTEIGARYSQNLRLLVHCLADATDPAVLHVTSEAEAAILDLERSIEPRMDPHRDGDLAHIADWASKHTGATIRIAALLHLASHPGGGSGQAIEVATITAAARIGHYYLAHALAVFDLMGADPVIDNARALLAWIQRRGKTVITRRDAFDQNRGRFGKAANTDPALATLEDHGHIRRIDPATGRRGRPSISFHVNPYSIAETP